MQENVSKLDTKISAWKLLIIIVPELFRSCNGVIDVSCSVLSNKLANHGELIQKILRNISFPGRDTDLITGKLIHFPNFHFLGTN